MAGSISVTQRTAIRSSSATIPTNYGALGTLVTVFFFWGFIAAGNSVFIPFCKHYFKLDQFQSQLIDFAFYTAYYIGALGLFAYGSFGGKDLVGKWGYKNGQHAQYQLREFHCSPSFCVFLCTHICS